MRPKPTRLSVCGGICMKRLRATTAARTWKNCWPWFTSGSIPEVITGSRLRSTAPRQLPDTVESVGSYLGFKSVFAFTATPRVFSGDANFEIYDLYRLRGLPKPDGFDPALT